MAFDVGLLSKKNIEGQGGKYSVPSVPAGGGLRPVDTISLADGMADIIAGKWQGIGLLDVLDGYTHLFGRQILIVEPGIDRHRLREKFPGVMIFTPAEFLDVVTDWPETEGVILAKMIFNGEIIGGVANARQYGINGASGTIKNKARNDSRDEGGGLF